MDADKIQKKIDLARVPRHVAIIMDGNGRWAKKRGLPRIFGHREGTKSVRDVVEAASKIGVQVLTLYSFSTENWSRPKIEIDGLMKLLKNKLRQEEASLNESNVRLETIGDISYLPQDVQDQLEESRNNLSQNTGLKLVLALNYGGRQDILQAVNRVVEEGYTNVTESLLSSHLHTSNLPDPDLLIRTSGEMRVSNFLLWQIAYAELYVTQIMWPDFRHQQFFEAILDYQTRERRFGAVV